MSTVEGANVEGAEPIGCDEARRLFAGLEQARGLVLAISGGPDSTALLLLAADWRRQLTAGPALLAVTIDHGLRPEAQDEALAVKRLAKRCGIAHRTLCWSEVKPKSGLQQAARAARYRLLADMAVRFGADHIVTAHTLDDQAETLLIRMSRGSGITGLGGMARLAPVPARTEAGLMLVRPFIDVAKERLVATVAKAGVAYADDPSNRDPRFTRSRIRALLPALAGEGLDAKRLSQLARRLRRAEAALAAVTDAAWTACVSDLEGQRLVFGDGFIQLPVEIRLRLLGRAIERMGVEGPVELGKLEALCAALSEALAGERRLRRTLAGAQVTLAKGRLSVERAPARRHHRPGAPRGTLNQRPTLLPQAGHSALK